ncbi:MAG: RluA family pseudouridine synthase [Clostridiales bacterium]|jgi:23S rRNA pseudouridine1911/1915/1917 synthase|nr:RluA family pseudouridine synthase [Clostridiales bacterium]
MYLVEQNHIRLDVFLAYATKLTRANVQRLIKKGCCEVDGTVVVKSSFILSQHSKVELKVEVDAQIDKILPQSDIDVNIIYQDEDIAVIDKPQGLTVHPANNIYSGTLVNALMYKLDNLSKMNGLQRPGIVHRLDKETSGIMLIAKHDRSHFFLSSQFANRQIKKLYLGVVEGKLKTDNGAINAPIGRHRQDRKKMSVLQGGRHAITKYKVLQQMANTALLEFDLLTGRTHQIRVHCKHIGHPIVGDAIYGNTKLYSRQLLHARIIEFKHPNGQQMKFEAKIPQYFEDFLTSVNCNCSS